MSGNTKLDFRRELDSGGILLINTRADYLGGAGAAFFGRFFIKLLEQQMHSRTDKSHPLFFVVDEVQEYFDGTIVKYLDQARKRNVACIFAHQRLAQFRGNEDLGAALRTRSRKSESQRG
jgi:hypothetical protein